MIAFVSKGIVTRNIHRAEPNRAEPNLDWSALRLVLVVAA